MRLYFVMLFQALQFAECVFFHEPSAVMLRPGGVASPQSDFGFAMAYQKGNSPKLVISAPSNDLDGKVYNCPLSDVFNSNMTCKEVSIDIKKIANETARVMSPNQKFHLGATIAATSDFFLTCAPLWTRETIDMSEYSEDINYAYGICFIYNDTAGSVHRYRGTLERFLGDDRILSIDKYIGGTGWNSLVDETNGLLLVAKTSLSGDILYLELQNILDDSKSIGSGEGWTTAYIDDFRKSEYSQDFNNVGFGLVAGKFFSNDTVYAFNVDSEKCIGSKCQSMHTADSLPKNMEKVLFLKYESKELALIFKNSDEPYEISHETVGIMFGSALAEADINRDGYSELLVGAPAQANLDGDGAEFGAVHIYLGGDIETINDQNRMRSIFGVDEGARFGSAIASSDIDGDLIPEIIVSAPYANLGEGLVYVLSGYELNRTLLRGGVFQQILVSELQLTQIIQHERFRAFGFSLQVLPDVDNNGFNELAIGAPGNATVMVFRCMQVITARITSGLLGALIVREQDDNFAIEVCVSVTNNLKSKSITGQLLVTNNIIGDRVLIKEPNFNVDLTLSKTSYCKNINVLIIGNHEPAVYKFISKMTLQLNTSSNEFNDKWVVMSPYSEMEKTLDISRHCDGEDCKTRLSFNISWSGGDGVYTLGLSKIEKVTVLIRNDGNNSYDACAWVGVRGARIAQIEGVDHNDGYLCQLPKPLRRNTEFPLNINLNMSNSRSIETGLKVDVKLYERCGQTNYTSQSLQRSYELTTENLSIYGSSQDLNITDKELLDEDLLSLKSSHEYYIKNNGSITWVDVYAVFEIDSPLLDNLKVSSTAKEKCVKVDKKAKFVFNCTFDLMPDSTVKFSAFMEVPKKNIDLSENHKTVFINSSMSVYMTPTQLILPDKLSTAITYQKVLTVGNNKGVIILIATICSIIILAVVVGVLYKFGFFQRKGKQKLNEEIRRSIKRKASQNSSEKENPTTSENLEDNKNSSEIKDQKTSDDEDDKIDIEIVDDCAFEENAEGSTNDKVKLIEEKAEVH